MIEELGTAIMVKYNASTALKALNTGGLHLTKLPEQASKPYITYHLIGGVPLHGFKGNHKVEVIQLQFSVFSETEGGVQCMQICDALMAAFDWTTLTYGTLTHIACRRVNFPEVSKDQFGIWQCDIFYEVTFQV